jgi:predicted DsbA family dithiol-disulfide isomerase
MLRIDAYADVVCPWCHIGRSRVKAALAERPDLDVDIRWRPFQLHPDMPAEGRDWRSFAEEKFGSWDRAQSMFERVAALGEEEGLAFDFDALANAPNTTDAHRLILWAEDEGRGDAAADAFFRAYFADGADLTDGATLAGVAARAGLPEAGARAVLEGDAYAEAVAESQQKAGRLGIQGVPCYVFNGRYALSGAQPVDRISAAIDTALEKSAA